MGLLKPIKYLMFEVSVLKEIVDGWIVRMNISRIDLTGFCTALIGQTCHEKDIQWIALAGRELWKS